MTTIPREEFASMVSLVEVPILNEKYWSKIPDLDSDGILLDLEDSAIPANKELVRERIVAALGEMSYFGERTVIVRVNSLGTPWGADDLRALGTVDADFLVSYPKIESPSELDEVTRLLGQGGHTHRLHVMIETASALINIEQIAQHPAVVGFHFGYVDFAADVGSTPFDEQGELSEVSSGYARSRIALTAAAYGLFATGGSLIPDYKDQDKVRRHVASWAVAGYTACIAVSPAHLAIINDLMRPSAEQIANAEEIRSAYATAVANGDPAAVVNGRVITLPDHRVAMLLLARAGKSDRD